MMSEYPPVIQQLIEQFTRMPGIGPKQAARCAFYIISRNTDGLEAFITSLENTKQHVRECTRCFSVFEFGDDAPESEVLCDICRDTRRDPNILCVTENEIALHSIEKSRAFRGIYFLLGGNITLPEKPNDIPRQRVKELAKRISRNERAPREIILATDENLSGNATARYAKTQLEPLGIKITRLGRGLPTGGELEYADEETLKNALEGRK